MYIVIFCSIIALYLTYLDSKGKQKDGMKWGFILVTFLAVIHYDYGNDYMSYYEVYQDIESIPFDFDAIMTGDVYREPGWVLMNYAFKGIGGFFMMVAVLNIIQNIIVYRFIIKEVNPIWYPLAVFIYLFTTSFYLMSFSMMRQFLVMCIFLALWSQIKQRKWIIPLIVLNLCHYIHSSAIVLVPFAFWGFVPMKNAKTSTIIFLIAIVALWISGQWVDNLFNNVLQFTETEEFASRYENTNAMKWSLGIGVIIQFIPLVVGVYYLFLSKANNNSMVLLSLLGFAIMPLAVLFSGIGRLGLYFSTFQIATIPIIYGGIKNKSMRICLFTLFMLITLYNYIIFFGNVTWVEKYSSFHTIFEHI